MYPLFRGRQPSSWLSHGLHAATFFRRHEAMILIARQAKRNLTLRDFVSRIYIPEHPDLTTAGAKQYLITVGRVEEALGRKPLLSELGRSLILEFLAAYKHAPATRKSKRGHLVAFWRHASERGYPVEPLEAVPTIRVPKTNPSAWREDEYGSILAHTHTQPRGAMLRAYLLLLWDTGCRPGAVRAATPDKVDLDRRVVRIYESKTRTEHAKPISPATVEALRALPPDRKRLIGTPYSCKWVNEHYTRLLKSLQLSATRKDKGQKSRRTKFTYVVKRLGLEAAKQHAGHSTDMSRFYLDATLVVNHDLVQLVPPPVA